MFSFVIMPNHIHLIWRINEMNGEESPHASFLKFTAHEFKKMLIAQGEEKAPSAHAFGIIQNENFEPENLLTSPSSYIRSVKI